MSEEEGMKYHLIPESERERVRNLIRANEIRELWIIHNKYKLTNYDYSCCGLDGMMDWYQHGLREGLI